MLLMTRYKTTVKKIMASAEGAGEFAPEQMGDTSGPKDVRKGTRDALTGKKKASMRFQMHTSPFVPCAPMICNLSLARCEVIIILVNAGTL